MIEGWWSAPVSSCLVLADVILAFATGIWTVMIESHLGAPYGNDPGIAGGARHRHRPVAFRGTAFGMFNFISGAALLLASLIAGLLWERVGPDATFLAGAAITLLGLLGTVALVGRDWRDAPDRNPSAGS